MTVNIRDRAELARETAIQLRMQMRFEKKFIPQYRKYIEKMVKDLIKTVLNNENFNISTLMEVINDKMPELERIIRDNQKASGLAFGLRTRMRIDANKKDAVEDSFLTAFEEWINRYALLHAKLITKTQRNYVKNIILGFQARPEGFTHLDVAKSIEDLMGDQYERWQALRIARTETHNAAMYGSEQMARETGLVETKTWVPVSDERTRSDHREINPKTVPLNGQFQVGNSSMDRPGDPEAPASQVVNCRCVMIYGLK